MCVCVCVCVCVCLYIYIYIYTHERHSMKTKCFFRFFYNVNSVLFEITL